MSWNQYIKHAQRERFTRVCIVDRGGDGVLATTDPKLDVATSWDDRGVMINENQELLADWSKRKALCFFGKKFTIVLRDKGGRWVVGESGGAHLVAREFKSIWFVSYSDGFKGAPDAFARASKIWEALAETGV